MLPKDPDVKLFYEQYNISLKQASKLFNYNGAIESMDISRLKIPENSRLMFSEVFVSSAGCDLWFIVKDIFGFYHKYYTHDSKDGIKLLKYECKPTFAPLMEQFLTNSWFSQVIYHIKHGLD